MLLTVPEAARKAGVGEGTIRRAFWSGILPGRKAGDRILIEEEGLANLPQAKPVTGGVPHD